MRPVKAVGKTGVLGTKLNQLDSGGDALDDLSDHWTAKAHKGERRDVVEQLQDLAAIKSVRVTILRYIPRYPLSNPVLLKKSLTLF